MESTKCIICGFDSNSSYKKFKDPLNPSIFFNIVKCVCGFIYLNPRPDSKEISKYYNNFYLPYGNNKGLLNFFYEGFKKVTFFFSNTTSKAPKRKSWPNDCWQSYFF